MYSRFIVYFLLIILSSCALKEESDLVMPTNKSKLFVECYTSPGSPIKVSLIRTSSFQEDLSVQLVWNAKAELILADTIITLQNIFYKDTESGKIINYASPYYLPAMVPGESIRLRIITNDEKDTLYATTEFVEPIKIVDWSRDGQHIIIRCSNGSNAINRFYGVYLEYEYEGNIIRKTEYYDYSLTNEKELTFRLNIPAEGYPYRIILYRIAPANYRFQLALQKAGHSNVDPFEAPVILPTNIQGGQGIFTYSTQDTLILQ